MKRAAISASRSLRSSLDTKLAPRSSWSPLFGAISTLGSTSTKNEDLDRLSTRLSQRLVSDTTGPINTRQNGNRTLSTRAKNQAKKQRPKAAGAKRAKRKAVTSKTTGRQIEPQWTAVGAALSTLEESIAKTNMLLHSLSSGEALARRTQSSRLTWDQKAALEVSKKKKPTPAHAAKALTALLQELGEKQVLATDLLSRLDEPVNSTKTPPSSTNVKSRGADSITQTINRSENEGPLTREEFESGWGVNELVPSTAENPAFVETAEQSPMSQKSDGTISAAPIETTSGELNTSMISLDSKSFLTITRDPEHYVPVPTLKHNLDRVLFNPGVHWLQDPHSRVYNFPPELQIMPAFTSFAYDRVNTFITSSKDTELSDLAKRHGKKFVGSTSSVSMILAHIYFLISAWRPLDLDVLSGAFFHMPRDFSAGQKMPYTFYLRRSDGVLAFDSGSQSEDPLDQNVLSYIGVMLEKLLTLPKPEFDALLQHAPEELIQGTKPAQREAYRYSMSKSLVLRSQLDCADERLPGTGVFDLKTRAAISVRQDIWNLEVGSGYQIRSSTGPLESFEREYYDLCRSAFLKYSFQARIGAMDGVFVAYHNTSRLFGFQYVPVEEMDQRLFGSHQGGERVFKACLGLLEVVAENVVSCFPDQEVKAMICTSESKDPELSVWVEPANWEELTPAPVHEVRLKVFHQINGERAPSGTQVTFEVEDWRINYTVARLPPSPETRARRDKAYARQQAIRVSSLPEGTTIEEFSNRMKDGVLEGYASRPDAGLSGEQGEVSGQELSESAASPDLSAWNKRFRTSTTPLVHSLRALSRKGLEDMDRWASDTSPKVVYKPRT